MTIEVEMLGPGGVAGGWLSDQIPDEDTVRARIAEEVTIQRNHPNPEWFTLLEQSRREWRKEDLVSAVSPEVARTTIGTDQDEKTSRSRCQEPGCRRLREGRSRLCHAHRRVHRRERVRTNVRWFRARPPVITLASDPSVIA
jgi:hypothetical protein